MTPNDPPVPSVPHPSATLARWAPPPLVAGEDGAAYDDLLVGISGAVKPAGILEDLWVRDVVDLIWDVIRLRRHKASQLAAAASDGMVELLRSLGEVECHALATRWAAREPAAVGDVNERLAAAGLGIDAVMARALVVRLDQYERIERLLAAAEARRAAALHELERHRAALAQQLREAAQSAEHAVEDAEFEVIAPLGAAIAPRQPA
jgi:hypothetical protein